MGESHLNIGAPMADLVGLPLDIDRGAMFAAQVNARRNSKFAETAKLWLKGKECAYCFEKADEAHHIFPFWMFPSIEMDERFWLPVCRSGADHHLHLAHLGCFSRFDILAREHAAIFKTCMRFSGGFAKLMRLAEKDQSIKTSVEEILESLTGWKQGK